MNDFSLDPSAIEFTMRDALYVLFRHKVKIILFFLTVSILVSTYVITAPPVFRSQASLFITEGRESVNIIPTTDSNRAITTASSQTQDIYNEIEILRSTEVYTDLVDVVGVEAFLGDESWMLNELSESEILILKENIANSIMDKVEIEPVRNTNIINIFYQANEPQLAHDIVSNLIDIFLERHIDVHYSAGTYEFYQSQTEDSQAELKRIEEELAEVQDRLNVSSFEEYRVMLLNRIDRLQQDYDTNATQIAEVGTSIQTRREMLNDLPETIETGRTYGSEAARSELMALQIREIEMLSKYTENSAQVRDIRRQIEEAERLIGEDSMVNQGINPITQQIQQALIDDQATYSSLLARSEELERVLGEAKEELSELNAVSAEVNQLERERQRHLDNYMKYSQNLDESRIDQIVQRQKLSNINIMQAATFPKQPLRSRKIRNLALGLFVAMFGGIGLAFVSEFLDHTMRRQEDVEKWLRLRTLVVIPDHSQDMVLIRNK